MRKILESQVVIVKEKEREMLNQFSQTNKSLQVMLISIDNGPDSRTGTPLRKIDEVMESMRLYVTRGQDGRRDAGAPRFPLNSPSPLRTPPPEPR